MTEVIREGEGKHGEREKVRGGGGARERGEGTLAPDHARLAPITDFSVSVCPTLGTCSPG